jgi:hypothetical protein
MSWKMPGVDACRLYSAGLTNPREGFPSSRRALLINVRNAAKSGVEAD